MVEILYPMGEGCQLWSEFNPSLYQMEVVLRDEGGKQLDELAGILWNARIQGHGNPLCSKWNTGFPSWHSGVLPSFP